MTPFEAGVSTGKEAVFSSGKESRGLPEVGLFQFISIVGIDEALSMTDSHYDLSSSRLSDVIDQAGLLGVALGLGVVDYLTTFDDPFGIERIVPSGAEFPDGVRLFDGSRNRSTGIVTETSSDWIDRIGSLASVAFSDNTWVSVYLDASGSMEREDWANVTPGLTSMEFGGARTSIDFYSDEKWIELLVANWELFKLSNPDIPGLP